MHAPGAISQQSAEVLPKVVPHAEPTYPTLARQTRIDGEVHVKFATDGESVVEVTVESGPALLGAAAGENVRT